MMMLRNEIIQLRAPELFDLDLIFQWENDTSLWYLSQTKIPFSRSDIEQFILLGNHDIYVEKQFRFMIVFQESQQVVGCVDLFDFDAPNRRAGIGVLIDSAYREQGFASQALNLLIQYARTTLQLHQLYCNILLSNKSSLFLFKRKHFQEIGVKKDWIFIDDKFHDEVVLQLIL